MDYSLSMKIIAARINVVVALFSIFLGSFLMSAPPLNADNNNPNSIEVRGVDVSLTWPLYFPASCSKFPVVLSSKNDAKVQFIIISLYDHTDQLVKMKEVGSYSNLSNINLANRYSQYASRENFDFNICAYELKNSLGPYKLKVYVKDLQGESEDTKEIFFNRGEKDAAAATKADEAAKAAAKKLALVVTCVKGKLIKTFTGSTNCPKGYTTYLTHKAFYDCQLDKRYALVGTAKLKDAGKTLTFSSVGKYGGLTGSATYSDVECALRIMKAQSFVNDQINTTRALDGMQKATWGKISAIWTYHPDNGLNISFNSK